MNAKQLQAIKWVVTGQKSKREVALLLDVDYGTVCKWTRGHRSPRTSFLYRHLVPNKFGGNEWIETDSPAIELLRAAELN